MTYPTHFVNCDSNFQEKPISIDRMLVKSKPMKKLCEYEGRGLPENVKSDCWNDVDETEYACSVSLIILWSINIKSFLSLRKFFNVSISGEKENHVENEPSRSWECHHWQLRPHLQTWRIQDQEDRGPGSVQDSVNTSEISFSFY